MGGVSIHDVVIVMKRSQNCSDSMAKQITMVLQHSSESPNNM